MQAVLISIQPKWCELIASGKKTVEVRKTKPKLETPFKVYIYETKGKLRWCNKCQDPDCERPYPNCACHEGWGKVIGEFVCDRIYNLTPHFDKPDFCNQYLCDWKWGEGTACLSFTEMNDYLKGKKGYGWHISDLVIYDKPRELSEFRLPCDHKNDCCTCKRAIYCMDATSRECHFCRCELEDGLTRPPQSWCYVEVQDGT